MVNLFHKRGGKMGEIDRRLILIAFLLILIGASFLRFNDLSWETLGYSEVETLQAVNEYLKGNFVHNFYTFDTPPLRRYIVALSLYVMGFSEFSFRLLAALLGILLVGLTFHISRRLYKDNLTALFASSIVAFSIIHLQFSRYLTDDLTLSLFYLISLYAFWNYSKTKDRESYILLGISLGLGFASRFMMIFPLITIIICALWKKIIHVKLRPLTISIENGLVKSFLIAIVVFFIVWPFSLVSLQTNFTVSVPDLDNHENKFSFNIPIFMLSAGKRLTNAGVDAPVGIYAVPVMSYFLAFLAKEFILITILFFVGLAYIFRNARPQDKFILFSLVLFFILLWFQKWGYTYRYVVIVIPLIAIVAARSLSFLVKGYQKLLVILVVSVILFLHAFTSGPSYALSYSPLKGVLLEPEIEGVFSEGMKESMNFLVQNCNKTLSGPIFAFNMNAYHKNFATSNSSELNFPICVVENLLSESESRGIREFLESHNCTLEKTVVKSGTPVNNIYTCA